MKPTITFEALADVGVPLARELVCTVWPLDEHSGQLNAAEPIVEGHPILVGSEDPQADESKIELPAPGNYMVDLGFPNGRRTRRAVSVSADEPYRFVVHENRYAPNSAGTTQSSSSFVPDVPRDFGIGINVPIQDIFASGFGTLGDSGALLHGFRPQVLRPLGVQLKPPPELEIRVGLSEAAPDAASLRTLRPFIEKLDGDSSGAFLVHHERVDELAHTVVLDAMLPDGDADFQNESHRRAWLLVSGRGRDTTLVPFPNGWAMESGKPPFLLTVRRKASSGDEATKWLVSLQLRDPSYGSLLEYLTRRDFRSGAAVSRTMRTTALTALYEKQMNPYAAAAGAYMLAMGDEATPSEQVGWMSKLTERFVWLPDGAIAQGYGLLSRTEKGTPAFEEGRRLLFAAGDRGLPYFTIGLTLLYEGLNFLVLANPEDQEAKAHLAAAMAAQISCVRTEVFCTLQTSRFYRLPHGPNERG